MDDRQSLADLIYRRILRLIEDGDLKLGQRISDLELAESFGYSRTPVREALQRLRSVGVIETSAQRYMRIVQVTPHQMQHCLVVWVALARALARVEGALREIVEGLERRDVTAVDAALDELSQLDVVHLTPARVQARD